MNIKGLVVVLAMSALLAGCANKRTSAWEEQNFKPYVMAQQQAMPAAYAQKWEYPNGTPSEKVVAGWKKAELINDVRSYGDVKVVTIGPQFYNLSFSGQRGLADAVAQMYNNPSYMVKDKLTQRVVGTYTSQGLQLY